MKFLIATNHSYMLWQFRRELVAELLTRGEAVLSMPFVGHEDDFAAMGCRCVETPVDRRGSNPLTDFRLFCAYRALLRAERPDLVLTYSIKPNIYAGYACARLDIPFCANVQGLGTAFRRKGLAGLVAVLYRTAMKKAGTVFFENRADADTFVRRRIVPASKAVVLPGAGVNLERYGFQPYPDERAGVRFLYLGRIMREKGVDELFAAARRLKAEYGDRVVFELAGFFEEEYRERVEELERDGVAVFHGFQRDPRPFYARAHCVVLPSYHEGMSNVLLEAAATGRALVASDIPGCREAVEDGVTGFLCGVRDPDSLYERLSGFMKLSEKARREMGEGGRAKMEREFDKRDVVAKTLAAVTA